MSESTEIWRERLRLEKARRDRVEALMDVYERETHYPAMQALRERCEAIGHRPQSRWHDNGLGWTWRHCGQCGATMDLQKSE